MEMYGAIGDAINKGEEDPSVRAIVMHGQKEFFCVMNTFLCLFPFPVSVKTPIFDGSFIQELQLKEYGFIPYSFPIAT